MVLRRMVRGRPHSGYTEEFELICANSINLIVT